MLVTGKKLYKLLEDNVLTGVGSLDQVNASSIDVRLGETLKFELPASETHLVSLRGRRGPRFAEVNLALAGNWVVGPGVFFLAHTHEKFNMPDNMTAEFRLKSSVARCGLGHLLAVWIDPGFNNSVLTLELKNELNFHHLNLHYLDSIGQVVFHEHETVEEAMSYRNRGRYNGDQGAQEIKP